MQCAAFNYRVGKATVHCIVKETCEALWDCLMPLVLLTPNESDWKLIAKDFLTIWNMPNCVGAINGKHIHIQAPPHSGSQFFNYKMSFSIVLMAVCDAH